MTAVPMAGPSDVVGQLLVALLEETIVPDQVVVCGIADADVAGLPDLPQVQRFTAPVGLPRQRNAILDCLEGDCVVTFFDDDFIPSPRYIDAAAAVFAAEHALVAALGSLIVNCSRTAGYTVAEARRVIASDGPPGAGWVPVPHACGCNLSFRLGMARRHGLRFDERQPLYAWSEDMDFSHHIARHGTLAAVAGARDVHLGVKHGRISGYRVGYSQEANPVCLYGKGSYTLGRVGRNVAINLARAAWPEPWVDRLRGNAMAVFDMLRGRLAPERILKL